MRFSLPWTLLINFCIMLILQKYNDIINSQCDVLMICSSIFYRYTYQKECEKAHPIPFHFISNLGSKLLTYILVFFTMNAAVRRLAQRWDTLPCISPTPINHICLVLSVPVYLFFVCGFVWYGAVNCSRFSLFLFTVFHTRFRIHST